MNHQWKEIDAYDDASIGDAVSIAQCERCNIVRIWVNDGSNPELYWRGEVVDTENECVERKPVTLDTIRKQHPNVGRDGLIWRLLHCNAPLTHIDTILDGFAELFPNHTQAFLVAKRERAAAADALLKHIMETVMEEEL